MTCYSASTEIQRSSLASRCKAVSLNQLGPITDGDWILNSDYVASGIRLLQVGDVGCGTFIGKSNRFVARSRADELRCTYLEAGDILISRMPDPIGRACVLPDLGYPCITAVDVAVWRPDVTRVDRDFLVFYLNSPDWLKLVSKYATGATRARISRSRLGNLPVPIPPLSEQRRIASRLREQLDEVAKARAAVAAQLEAAKKLPAAILCTVFTSLRLSSSPERPLGEVCDLLPAKSIALAGDADVQAVTSACLTETGFRAAGIKRGKMWAMDVPSCVLQSGEVLISRSNTSELVGRASLYEGEPPGIVASDLIIRIMPRFGVSSAFLARYFSFLFVTGHWAARAGGASGSMKKITRRQLEQERVPVPPLIEQEALVSRLADAIAPAASALDTISSRLASLDRLPAALLREAFFGRV